MDEIVKIFQEEYGVIPPEECFKKNVYNQVIFSLGKITLRVTEFPYRNKNTEWKLEKYEDYVAIEKWRGKYLISVEIDI